MTGEPPVTDVTGGSHGLTVAYDHALALAGDYDAAGGRMREWAARSGGVLLDDDLLESALLSPVSFAEAEAAVLAATSGPDGVLVAHTWEVLDHQLGFALGYTVAAGAPALVLPAAGLALLWTQLPPGTQAALQDASLTEVQEWLVDHPEAVQHLVNGGGGLLEGLWDGLTPVTPGGPFGVPLLVPDTEAAAGLVAALYSDGHHQTSPSPLTIPGSETAPADLAALVQHLAQVDAQPNGTVEVQTIRTADGSVRHVVYLPGTDDLTTTPWSQDADIRDLGTNLLLVSGQDNAYQQGILDAMQQAGVQPDEPVALVGHSQGGMEAAAILAQSSGGHGLPYSVTHVVTAGAPTAHLDGFPAGSHVLSLENRGDVVPLLDGEDNPDSAEQVTVRFDGHEATVAGSHDLAQYVHGALAVQASDDPSILEQLSSLESAGFVGSADGQEVTSQVFQITRVP